MERILKSMMTFFPEKQIVSDTSSLFAITVEGGQKMSIKRKRSMSFLLAVVMLFSLWVMPGEKVYAQTPLPSISKSNPIYTYTYSSTGKAYRYTDSTLKTKYSNHWIDCPKDLCRIIEIKNQAVKVIYPTPSGDQTGWFKREDFTYRDLASYGASKKFKCTKKVTTYKWKNKNNEFGYISSGDTCYLLRGDSESDWLQLIYPVPNGYKMGWVKGADIRTVIWPVTTKITLNKTGVTITGIGNTAILSATVTPSNSTQGVSWSTSNSSVATVSGGTVKAVGKGTATITAKSGSKSASATVTVVDNSQPAPSVVKAAGVSLNKASISMKVGDSAKLTATVSPSNATNKSVTWSSSNTSVATVNSSGNVTAKKAGKATITVTTKDGGYTAKASVNVSSLSYRGSPQKGSYGGKQFLVFSQKDKEWGDVPYLMGTVNNKYQKTKVAWSGCHLLSLVNGTYWLSGKFIDPEWLAKYAINKGYRTNGSIKMEGLYKDISRNYGKTYGIKYIGYQSVTSNNRKQAYAALKSHIKKGEVAIGGGMGHVMVIIAYNSSKDSYLVLDSYSYSARGTQKKWYVWKSPSQMTGKFGFKYFFFIGKR